MNIEQESCFDCFIGLVCCSLSYLEISFLYFLHEMVVYFLIFYINGKQNGGVVSKSISLFLVCEKFCNPLKAKWKVTIVCVICTIINWSEFLHINLRGYVGLHCIPMVGLSPSLPSLLGSFVKVEMGLALSFCNLIYSANKEKSCRVK